MISEKYKCIFIHVPKTAGTSIEKLLGHFQVLDRGVQDHRTIREVEKLTTGQLFSVASREGIVSAAREIRGLFRYPDRLSAAELEEYFKFTFVRNPWSRVYSWYRNTMNDSILLKSRNIPADCSLDRFLTDYSWQTELRPQLTWLKNREGKINFDFIGRFENLENDFHSIAEKLDISDRLPHMNPSKAKLIQEGISEFSRKTIAERYAEEIEMFGYTFDGPF